MSVTGPSRRFAAARQLSRFRREADVEPDYECAASFDRFNFRNKALSTLRPRPTVARCTAPEAQADHFPSASARSLKRWILPVAVFGSSVRNSSHRGYL
jgi:hypothetical protein